MVRVSDPSKFMTSLVGCCSYLYNQTRLVLKSFIFWPILMFRNVNMGIFYGLSKC